MKKYLFFPFLTAALLALFSTIGCDKKANDDVTILGSPDTILVKLGETAQIFAGNFTIRLDSVIDDSRCPANAECFWEGRVDARFVFTQNGTALLDTLANGGQLTDWPDDKTEHFGFTVQMLEMTPYPQEFGTIPQVDYVAKLAVLPK